MKNVEIKSILNSILDEIKTQEDANVIRSIAIERVTKSNINMLDKTKMLQILSSKRSYFDVIKTVYDLILKYEGQGVISKSLNGGDIR